MPRNVSLKTSTPLSSILLLPRRVGLNYRRTGVWIVYEKASLCDSEFLFITCIEICFADGTTARNINIVTACP